MSGSGAIRHLLSKSKNEEYPSKIVVVRTWAFSDLTLHATSKNLVSSMLVTKDSWKWNSIGLSFKYAHTYMDSLCVAFIIKPQVTGETG